MGKVSRRIVISGYYGYNNSGDEAVLHSIITALREEADASGMTVTPIVLSGNPAETVRLHGVEAVHRMRPAAVWSALRRSDALISGGGSLLQDVTGVKSIPYYLGIIRMARWAGKPAFVYAQGIGPVRRTGWFGPLIRSTLSACEYVSVRDDESKELLVALGMTTERIDVVPDPVMGLGLSLECPALDSAVSRVGVSVRFWREDRKDLDAVAEGIARLMASRPGLRTALLPFHLPSDKQASEYTADRLKQLGADPDRVEVHSGTEHPEEMLQEVARCDALIGMRLHSLIYAATAGVPPIGISYDPKIDRFLNQIGETSVGSTELLHPDALADLTSERIRTGKSAWSTEKMALIEELQQNARIPAQQILRVLRI